jgi:uncharacterized protein YdhG (YjbR/CyaY superfamily)
MPDRAETIDDYIRACPTEVQPVLRELRKTIRRIAPGAEESISYQIPTFKLNGRALVYFAAWKHHIGLYPVPALDEDLEREIGPFRAAKDSLRFPLGQPVPYPLVEKVVAVLVARGGPRAG